MNTKTQALAWSAIALLALYVAGYAVAILADPDWRSPFVRELLARQNFAAWAHFGGGGIALLAGALQVNARLREGFRGVHRWLGRVYVAAVALSGIAGLTMAFHANGGVVGRWGFGLLAVSWLGCTLAGWRRAVASDLTAHRRWMIRSYALTLAAVTLRLYLPLSQWLGIPLSLAYPAIAWLCWIPNLLVAQWLIRARPGLPALRTAR